MIRGKPFHERYMPEPNSGCWLWLGSLRNGYGVFEYKSAHRYSYLIHKGNIPKGMDVMHSCDIRCCVNPTHLSVGTRKDNVRDMISKGREWHYSEMVNATKTHCPQGHEYKGENLYLEGPKKLHRRCLACVRFRREKRKNNGKKD